MKVILLGRTVTDTNWTIWERQPQNDDKEPDSLTPYNVLDEGLGQISIQNYYTLDQGQNTVDLDQYSTLEQGF